MTVQSSDPWGESEITGNPPTQGVMETRLDSQDKRVIRKELYWDRRSLFSGTITRSTSEVTVVSPHWNNRHPLILSGLEILWWDQPLPFPRNNHSSPSP